MAYDFCTLQEVEGKLCLINKGVDQFNHGSVLETYVFLEKDIISFPSYNFAFDNAGLAQLAGMISLRAGAQVYAFRFTPDTGSFTEPMGEDDDGITYDQLLTISIPKDRPEITWLKHRMRLGRYAILYRDANGLTKSLRNLRVKMDLNIGKVRSDYNGHVMYARRLSSTPALHFTLSPSTPITSLFEATVLAFDIYQETLIEGWQTGKNITLPNIPFSAESVMVFYNSALKLRSGEHYVVNDNIITLKFSDIPEDGAAADIQVFYAINQAGTSIASFAQHAATKTVSYLSGETITLPSSPISDQYCLAVYNDSLVLRLGTDYTLAGDTVTLLFSGSPTPTDTDVFSFFYAVGGAALTINNWKQYLYTSLSAESSGFSFSLPHTPIADSLNIWFDSNFRLRPGTHYNLVNNEVTILFDVDANTSFDCWYAY